MISGHASRRRRALTLVESVLSIMIIGGMLVATLDTVGAAQRTRALQAWRATGDLLALDLLNEILARCYEDPDLAPGSFGLGGDEVNGNSRARWDDVDDYNGLLETPPRDVLGNAITGAAEFTRAVRVTWVKSEDWATPVGSDTRLKRIVVSVWHGDQLVAELSGLRAALDEQHAAQFE